MKSHPKGLVRCIKLVPTLAPHSWASLCQQQKMSLKTELNNYRFKNKNRSIYRWPEFDPMLEAS